MGKDHRTIKQLNGKQKLDSGIYAIVEVIGKPKLMDADKKGYWYEKSGRQKTRYRIPVKYIHNLHEEPILLDTLNELNVTGLNSLSLTSFILTRFSIFKLI
ncbi:hypothetical protein COK80_09145 [Bacillus anthracis]|nr:hypothetical protein COK80_09145 [Bacillus anthracis]